MATDPGSTERPWDEREFEDPADTAELDRLDAEALLESWWDSQLKPLAISAVLRSWEDRFGARLLQIGFDRIRLLVERPPRTADAALRLAAEQHVFCDECQHGKGEMGTDLPGLDTVPGLAQWVLATPAWTFWWD